MVAGFFGLSGVGLRFGEEVVEVAGFDGAGAVGAGIEAGDLDVSCVWMGDGGTGGTVTGAAAWTLLRAHPAQKTDIDAATTHMLRAEVVSFSTRRMGQIRGRVESGLTMR